MKETWNLKSPSSIRDIVTEYAEYLQEEEGCNNVDTSKNFEFKGKSNLCIMSSSKEFLHAEAGTHNPCGQSHFECTVRPYCISNGYLVNGLSSASRMTKDGDYMMFEVISNGEKPIWKFHNRPNPNTMSTRKAFPKEESATHSSLDQSHFMCTVRPYCLSKGYLRLPKKVAVANGLIDKKCGVIIRDERQRAWNLRLATNGSSVHILGGWDEFRVANDLNVGDCMMFGVVANGEKPIWKFYGAATHKPFGQTHFACIIRPYCISNDLFCIPTKFVLANGLTTRNVI